MANDQLFKTSRIALLTVAIGLIVPVVNAQPGTPAPPDAKTMPAEIVKPMPKSGMDMKQGMDMKPMMTDMHDKMMGMKSSGNADVDFAMMMRMHHQGAITMAEAELQNGKDPQMRTMAKSIISAQKKEMATFEKFLEKRGEPSMKMGSPAMLMSK